MNGVHIYMCVNGGDPEEHSSLCLSLYSLSLSVSLSLISYLSLPSPPCKQHVNNTYVAIQFPVRSRSAVEYEHPHWTRRPFPARARCDAVAR